MVSYTSSDPTIAQSIALGIGSKVAAVGDAKLQFEIGRVPVNLTSFDFVNNKLIFKGAVPDEFSGIIYEIAVYSSPYDTVAGEFGSRTLARFDSNTETWVDASTSVAATYSTTNARIGADALRHTPAASATKSDILSQISLDLSGYSNADVFVLAFNAGTAFTSSVKVRLQTNASNYYEITSLTPTAGYKVVEIAKSAAVATGAPDWSNITSIQVSTTSTGGGASQIDFDGIRIEDVDTVNPEYVMVSREPLITPFTKVSGKTQEVEFAMDINV